MSRTGGTIEIQDNPLNGLSVFTFSAWLKRGSLSVDEHPTLFSDTFNNNYFAHFGSAYEFQISSEFASDSVSDATVPEATVNAWHHYALTWNGVDLVLYKDTVSYAMHSGGVGDPIDAPDEMTVLPSTLPFDDFEDGYIAELSIYDSVLDAGEIASLAVGSASTLVGSGSLICYFPFRCDSPNIDEAGEFTVDLGSSTCSDDHPLILSSSDSETASDSVLGVWEFNRTLLDTVRDNDFTSPEGSLPTYERVLVNNLLAGAIEGTYALKFEDKRLSAGNSFTFTNGNTFLINVGFWYKTSTILGFSKNTTTKRKTPVLSPIICKADSEIVDGIESITTGEWILYESGYSDTENIINLAICSTAGNPDFVFQSKPFEPGTHHVYFVYEGTSTYQYVRIEIDGDPGIVHVIPQSASVLSDTTASLRINDVVVGPVSHKRKNETALMYDLVVRSNYNFGSSDSVRMIRFGWEYLVYENLFFKQFEFLGFSYTQPSTVTTTSITSAGGDLILSKSNGQIIRGHRPVWDVEHKFDNDTTIDIYQPSDKTKVQATDSGLKITGASIRIP